MTVHEQFADDLALYALGALSGEEKTSLESHLQECASCRRELEQLRGDAALLALSTSGPRPPARAKTRLMDAIASEPRTQPSHSRLNWWAILGWATAGLMLVFVIGVSRHNQRLSSRWLSCQGWWNGSAWRVIRPEKYRRFCMLPTQPHTKSYRFP